VTVACDGGVELDRTVFYAASGGQPGDAGTLTTAGGRVVVVRDAVHPDGDRARVLHLLDGPPPAAGERVTLAIDWDRRHRLMRMHTALHLLSVALPFGVTGGAVGAEKGRLDFDMPEPPEDVAAVEAWINARIADDLAVAAEWITDAELEANPGLVKTMSVKPPMGTGRVRLIEIAGLDLQPCGGTHVRATAEIAAVRVTQIEKKGKQNRRVRISFAGE